MAQQTSWSNPPVPLGSSYGPCIPVNQNQQPVPSGFDPNLALESAWASSSTPNIVERERERDGALRPAAIYPPSAYGVAPYGYPQANPNPPLMHQAQQPQPTGLTYNGQQLVGRPVEHAFQQQPPISSFGPAPTRILIHANRRPGDWNCARCMAHNFASREECYKCRQLKPGGISRRPGDWWCGKCNGHNYAYRVDCFRCSADKSEGKSEPNNVGSVAGLRWANDWDCPRCNAHCFGSRMECFKCNEPKPVDLSTDV